MRYTEDHEWLREENDLVIVGITLYAAEQLGDVVFVELPEIGLKVAREEEIVVIESVKAASDIAAPLDGEIVEVNEAIVESPALVNEDPEGEAWFFKIRPSEPTQIDSYMNKSEYHDFVS